LNNVEVLISIDPGVSGAIAIYRGDLKTPQVIDIPVEKVVTTKGKKKSKSILKKKI